MKIKIITALFLIFAVYIALNVLNKKKPLADIDKSNIDKAIEVKPLHSLSIVAMRAKPYLGSNIIIEETLSPGGNYDRYVTSYQSDGLKIYALLTVPQGKIPAGGWPAIIFNHGYIPPEQYRTTERYLAYTDAFSRNGYIVFKPDYRGHGSSEGKPEGAYYSPAYTIDVLNAVASIKKYQDVNPEKIGMWGHSLGGNITVRSMTVAKDIKAGVIWAGVVGTYEELMNKWRRSAPWQPSPREAGAHIGSIRRNLETEYGTINNNPEFWHSIDPRYYLNDISGPVQIHHGLSDEEAPVIFSESLANDLKKNKKTVEIYTYVGADHNLSGAVFDLAMQRSIEFFDRYLKK